MSHGERIRSALESIPKGEFLLTAAQGGRSNGVLVDFVGQCANDPPMLVVATAKGQVLTPIIRDSRSFAVSLVTDATRALARSFVRSSVETDDPFIGMPITHTPRGFPILMRTQAWFECDLVRHLDIDADCELYVGTVASAFIDDASDIGLDELAPARKIINGTKNGKRRNGVKKHAGMSALAAKCS